MRVEKNQFLKVGSEILGVAPLGGEIIPGPDNSYAFKMDDGSVVELDYTGPPI